MLATTTTNSGIKTMDDNKRKALASALGQIEKQFGKGAVMRLGDRTDDNIETVSTGSLGLDIALGVGGLPRGRVKLPEERRHGGLRRRRACA
ncbi:hypothetical protein GCM10010981_38590 [Dyella nitratireducens]|uniref:Protein RecA n=1 Tax=Dyella nitratireducens TaxID=1849580 RepID=A0ABQ1GKR6_9GAMM|nr:hypothetical protein GCM10010981_38590 [Dyella nitratireducens]